MKKLTFFLTIFFLATVANAQQTQFFDKAKIEFEKTLNVPAYYKELDPEWFDQIKDRLPQNVITYHEFTGDSSKSIYKPGREVPIDPKFFFRSVADKNIVFSDYKSGKAVSQKPVFEETFLVDDSMSRIVWKLTPDIRTIAGYDCRKAVGILDDSIAVFAFYTDEILIPGGPEGIHGLPGMILGVGVPRLHTTWFATKVDVFDINMNAVTPATKGKKVNRSNMLKSIDKVLREWGTYGSKMAVNFSI